MGTEYDIERGSLFFRRETAGECHRAAVAAAVDPGNGLAQAISGVIEARGAGKGRADPIPAGYRRTISVRRTAPTDVH